MFAVVKCGRSYNSVSYEILKIFTNENVARESALALAAESSQSVNTPRRDYVMVSETSPTMVTVTNSIENYNVNENTFSILPIHNLFANEADHEQHTIGNNNVWWGLSDDETDMNMEIDGEDEYDNKLNHIPCAPCITIPSPEILPDIESDDEPESDIESDPESDAETEPESDAEQEPESDAEPESESESESEYRPENIPVRCTAKFDSDFVFWK
jgi:hypothetical protein